MGTLGEFGFPFLVNDPLQINRKTKPPVYFFHQGSEQPLVLEGRGDSYRLNHKHGLLHPNRDVPEYSDIRRGNIHPEKLLPE